MTLLRGVNPALDLAQPIGNLFEGFRVLVDHPSDGVQLPVDVSERGEDVDMRRREQRHHVLDPFERLLGRLRGLFPRLFDQVVDKALARAKAGDLLADGTQLRNVFSVRQFQTPRVARAVTRYVAGAILAASRQLQRKGWVRRAADLGSRPSGTTGGDR